MPVKMLTCMLVVLVVVVSAEASSSISDVKSLYRDIFANYSSTHRPLYNQSHHVTVHLMFNLVAIPEVDLVRQILYSNAWLNITWTDEFLTWRPEDYGGIDIIHPPLTDIWRPKLIIPVSLADRDMFKDLTSSLFVYSDGSVRWFPAANFITDCKLHLDQFPLDVQTCQFRFLPANYLSKEVQVVSSIKSANLRSFTANGEWTVPSSRAYAAERTFSKDSFSFFYVDIDLERRPQFFIINVILPIVALSFLNIMVFVLPSESGEKVSYAITCLLSLTVFMSIVSDLLPKTSDDMPLLTYYMSSLLGISVLCAFATIVIVKREVRRKSGQGNRRGHSPVFRLPRLGKIFRRWTNNPVDPFPDQMKSEICDHKAVDGQRAGEPCDVTTNADAAEYGVSADNLCLVCFLLLWFVASVVFVTFLMKK